MQSGSGDATDDAKCNWGYCLAFEKLRVHFHDKIVAYSIVRPAECNVVSRAQFLFQFAFLCSNMSKKLWSVDHILQN